MSAAGLRCRVCETVSLPEPVDACRRCDGPTDLTYDWDRHRARRVAPLDRRRPGVALAVQRASAGRGEGRARRRLDAAPPRRPPVRAPRSRSPSEARRAQPDPFLQGPHRHDRRGHRARPRRDDALLLLDGQPRPRGRCGRRRDRARGDRARTRRGRSRGGRCTPPGRTRLCGRRHLRRLPPSRARAGRPLPLGLRQRQPAPVRERGREDDLVRDRRTARLAAARCRRLPRSERHALLEARAGVRRAGAGAPRRRARAEDVRRTGARLEPDRRGVRRRPRHLARRGLDRGCLARRRRPVARRPRDRRRARDRRRTSSPSTRT